MSITPPSFSIPALTACNYNSWYVATTTAAKMALPTHGPMGGLGLLLPPDDYAKLNQEAFTFSAKPASVNNQAAAHQQLQYDREQVALGALTTAIFTSIPLATQQSCPGYHPELGTCFIDLPTMMHHVRRKYGDASMQAYAEARAALNRPYANEDIDTFLGTHVHAHLTCLRAGNPLNDIEKVESLISALGGPTGPFAFTIARFEEESAILANRRFEDTPAPEPNQDASAGPSTSPAAPVRLGLASRIRLAAPRILTANTTGPAAATTKGYYGAAAVNAPPASTLLRDEIVAALKDILPPLLATATPAANAISTTRARPRNLYCWTHGLGGHTGKECKRPAPGHDNRATVNRRMGGSNKQCPK